jgi:hypothetical protein
MHEQFMPHLKKPQVINAVALSKIGRYSLVVAANSATGFGDPSYLAHRRPSDSRRFFCACRIVLWQLCVGDLRVCRVPSSRFANLRTAVTLNRLATISGSSFFKLGVSPMPALNPFKNRAAAHRAMALAALHANSSLATRLSRYNNHMAKARALETAGGAQ